MPRMGRVILPRYPHHIVQRGHNRQVVFAEAEDYRHYLDTLIEFKETYGVQVFAYCLMTNHVHLLLAPQDHCSIGKLMKRLAGRQTRSHNSQEGRSGSLWEGRYKSSPVQTEDYLLACCRYIELNPVRARLIAEPESYPWSSCRYRLGEPGGEWLDHDPCYLALGSGDEERRRHYREFLRAGVPHGELELIRDAVQRGQLTGTGRFTQEVAEIIGRRIERRGPGRPVKQESNEGQK